jgi:hypothetical protein
VPVLTAGHHGSSSGHRNTASSISQAAARNLAVAWVASQVGRDIAVACDAATCSDLAQHGFPAGKLNVLKRAAPNPYGSALVIATAAIRRQFGAKLANVYAPMVLASFGTGADLVEIRIIAPNGPAAFSLALTKNLQARQSAGAQLVTNRRLTFSALARQQLTAGRVDLRLISAIAHLLVQQPLNIVGFASMAPGAGPHVPLRYVYLAESDAAADLPGARYLSAVLSAVHALSPPDAPDSVATVRLPGGPTVLRIGFPGPSPLALLPS